MKRSELKQIIREVIEESNQNITQDNTTSLPEGWSLEKAEITDGNGVFTFIDDSEYEATVIYEADEMGESFDWSGNNEDTYDFDLKDEIEQFIIEYIVDWYHKPELNEEDSESPEDAIVNTIPSKKYIPRIQELINNGYLESDFADGFYASINQINDTKYIVTIFEGENDVVYKQEFDSPEKAYNDFETIISEVDSW